MKIVRSKDSVLFRTPYSEKCDLVQKFSGVAEFPYAFNHTVNFTEAGFVFNNKWDEWHIDIPLAISNDEAPPLLINGEYLGANHELPEAVCLHLPNHGKTSADIGSVWMDDEGTKWVLISALCDTLTFISENIGESNCNYAFKHKIVSRLNYVENGEHTEEICADGESWRGALKPIIRHTKRSIIAFKDGKKRTVNRAMECECAEICEEYEIVNPVSMIEEIIKNRPEDGYKTEICFAMGDAMAKVNRTYRIENDGAILCDFYVEKLMDIKLTRCMGAMFQEKLDTYGGGIYRYIPKTKPLITEEGEFDFSFPADTASENYPERANLTEEYWETPGNPPDRIIDYFRSREGENKLGFVCGYLPAYDALPEIRSEKLGSAVYVIFTRKAYPFFFDKDFSKAHGVAYRKYFKTENSGVTYYTIPFNDKEYLYVDFFKKGSLILTVGEKTELCEKSEGIKYEIHDKTLSISGEKGYAVFIIEK